MGMRIDFCKSCGRMVLKDFSFCPYCGGALRVPQGLEQLVSQAFRRLEVVQCTSMDRQIDTLMRDLDCLEAEMDSLIHSIGSDRV